MASDEGIINCIDAANGNTVWQKRVGGSFAGSPIYADGHLYFCDRDGQSTLIKPGRSSSKWRRTLSTMDSWRRPRSTAMRSTCVLKQTCTGLKFPNQLCDSYEL